MDALNMFTPALGSTHNDSSFTISIFPLKEEGVAYTYQIDPDTTVEKVRLFVKDNVHNENKLCLAFGGTYLKDQEQNLHTFLKKLPNAKRNLTYYFVSPSWWPPFARPNVTKK